MIKMHVDDFVAAFDTDPYVSWVLLHFRLPAVMQSKFRAIMEKHKLFCTWGGWRYRVIGASRMGYLWLAKDLSKTSGYDERVDITECTNFGPTPMSLENHPNFHAVKFCSDIMSSYHKSLRGDATLNKVPDINDLVVSFTAQIEKIVDDHVDKQFDEVGGKG